MPLANARVLMAMPSGPERLALEQTLNRMDCRVSLASDGPAALQMVSEQPPDLMLLAQNLAGVDGLAECLRLRADPALHRLPVFILSPAEDPVERLLALELGADAYLRLACDPRELLVRMRNTLGRQQPAASRVRLLLSDGLRVALDLREVSLRARLLKLTPSEFALLAALMQAGGRVLPREELLRAIHSASDGGDVRPVDSHVRRLRAKLGSLRSAIHTVREAGYRFVPTVTRIGGSPASEEPVAASLPTLDVRAVVGG